MIDITLFSLSSSANETSCLGKFAFSKLDPTHFHSECWLEECERLHLAISKDFCTAFLPAAEIGVFTSTWFSRKNCSFLQNSEPRKCNRNTSCVWRDFNGKHSLLNSCDQRAQTYKIILFSFFCTFLGVSINFRYIELKNSTLFSLSRLFLS